MRGNIDYVFATRESTHSIKRKLHEYFFGCIKKYKTFEEIFSKVTRNNGVLVINKTDSTGDIVNMLFRYKAVSPPRMYKVGSKQIWDFHEQTLKNKKKKLQDKKKDEVVIA